MRNIIATIAVLLSVCANAQYKEILHAHIDPTNKVVVSIPDWAKSDTPPIPEIVVIGTNDVVNIISNEVSDIVDSISIIDRIKQNSVVLHPITPETTDDKITLKPMDGKANWVREVEIPPSTPNLTMLWNDIFVGVATYDPETDEDLSLIFSAINVEFERDEIKVLEWNNNSSTSTRILCELISRKVIVLSSDDGYTFEGVISEGTRFYITSWEEEFPLDKPWYGYMDSFELVDSNNIFDIYNIFKNGVYFPAESEIVFWEQTGIFVENSPNVVSLHFLLPASTGHARAFSLALSTDIEQEKKVTWEGADKVIEAFTSASNIVPGTNTFFVYESMTNTFVIDRIPRSDNNSSILTEDGLVPSEMVRGISNGTETRTADALFRSADNVNTLWTYVYGESVWIAVTNYMRTISGVAPSFQLWEVRDGNTNCVYWSAEEIDIRVGDKIDVAMSNIVNTVVTQKADRAWAKYQSMTGADNPQPNDITIVSTPSVMLSGGYEWQRFLDTGNEIWILKCNCPTMLGTSSVSNGVDTGSGYFKITDAEGKTHFSVEKTDSKLVDAVPDSVSFSNDGNQYFQVSFQSNIKPSLYVSTDLNTPFIECKEDSENDYGLTCSWSESDGIYTATIIYNTAEGKPSKLFAYGKVTQEGSVVIKNTAATSFDGGIIIGGNKYTIGTAVIDGKTVLTLENGQAVSE